jgi:hypothetical protein
MVNATGWNELLDANLVGASFTMFDTAMAGWTVAILFFVFQIMLYLKTKNATLMWITGLFFLAMYASLNAFTSVVRMESVTVMFVLLVFELAGIMFVWLWK